MYKTHPAAAVMPPLTDSEYKAMVSSIKQDGLLYPIKLLGDLIIDGNHRQKACLDAQVEPVYEQVETDNPARYVLSCDTRRHLTTKQRSAIGAELANMSRGNPNLQNSKNTNLDDVTEEDAAKLMGVSKSSITKAKKVMREDPKRHEAIKRGEKVKAKPKRGKGVSWRSIAVQYGLMGASPSGVTTKAIQAKLKAIDPDIEFTLGGLVPRMAHRVEEACLEIVRRQDPEGAKKTAEKSAEYFSEGLSMTATQKLAAAIKAHQRAWDAEYEYRIQRRIQDELQPILADYNKSHDKHLELMKAYDGVMSLREYKLILGLLHSDSIPGLDDIKRKRLDKAFNIFQSKKEILCGVEQADNLSNTMPKTVAELLKRRK